MALNQQLALENGPEMTIPVFKRTYGQVHLTRSLNF
jgi:hypothetical protein